MTTALRALVTSLGDFPLDPDSGKAWLWSGTGERLIWVSETASRELGPVAQDNTPAAGAPAFLRSFAPLLDLPAPDREPVRVQQLSFGTPPAKNIYTCLCRHVPLSEGGYGLLAVAIGAPARSLASMQEPVASVVPVPPPVIAAPVEPEPVPTPKIAPPELHRVEPPVRVSIEPVQQAPIQAAPVLPPQPMVEHARAPLPLPEVQMPAVPVAVPAKPSPAAPGWTNDPSDLRRPLRFVWQTDKDGRFVHLSRELAQTVGLSKASLLGRTWGELASSLELLEAEGVLHGLASRETWSAPPVLWPVEGSTLGVPVEMAATKVMEAGAFSGFRGYGIARIERAVERPASAAEAIASDPEPETEHPEDRFGPAALRALRRTPKPLVVTENELKQTPVETQSAPAAPLHPPAQPEPTVSMAAPVAVQPTIAAPSPTDVEGSRLTTTEREAFREIARALGASATSLPAAPVTDGAKARGRPLQTGKPLDALKQDLLQLTGGQTQEKPAPAVTDHRGTAPVIPYDALQARREQKLRQDPLTAASVQIVDKVPVGLLVMQDGKAVFANRHLLDLARFPDLATFLRDGGAARLFGVADSGTVAPVGSFPINTRDGETVTVEATVQAIVWDDAPATLTSIRKPLAAPPDQRLKTLELDLIGAKAELGELRSVLDTATDGVILLDFKGQILGLNRSAEALFGFDQKEIAGESLTILLEPESHIAALDYLEGLKSNGVKSILNDGREVRGRERNGGAIPLFMTIGRIGEKHGSARFCAVLRDVTHWKKVESELLDAKRLAETTSDNKTDFLAKISHEIRTPLNAILGFSEVMMTEGFGPIGNDRYRQYARDINASGTHIISLVNDLLDLSKVAAGKLELSFGSVDVNAVVAASVAMIQPQANAGRVIVRSQLANTLPPVVADERSIRQVMLNLLSNAAKFTDAGGQVVASTSLTDKGEVVIRVRDTGVGMSTEEVKRAMEPFRQIPGPRASGGTGLGLPLTKALVEANRAGFSLTSETGKGTLVEVVFPSTRVLAE